MMSQRVGEFTLMAGTGTPGGQPEAPNCTNSSGCPDNRVILVDHAGNIVWQYGTFGPGGSGPNQLNTPVQSTWLPNRHVLITDQANQRIIEVDVATNGSFGNMAPRASPATAPISSTTRTAPSFWRTVTF